MFKTAEKATYEKYNVMFEISVSANKDLGFDICFYCKYGNLSLIGQQVFRTYLGLFGFEKDQELSTFQSKSETFENFVSAKKYINDKVKTITDVLETFKIQMKYKETRVKNLINEFKFED